MNCPVCDGRLREVHKHGVEVDICPDCKGVWLDRGELEKILDMAAGGGPQPATENRSRPEERRSEAPEPGQSRSPERYREEDSRERGERPRRRGSWLSELFEAGGDD